MAAQPAAAASSRRCGLRLRPAERRLAESRRLRRGRVIRVPTTRAWHGPCCLRAARVARCPPWRVAARRAPTVRRARPSVAAPRFTLSGAHVCPVLLRGCAARLSPTRAHSAGPAPRGGCLPLTERLKGQRGGPVGGARGRRSVATAVRRQHRGAARVPAGPVPRLGTPHTCRTRAGVCGSAGAWRYLPPRRGIPYLGYRAWSLCPDADPLRGPVSPACLPCRRRRVPRRSRQPPRAPWDLGRPGVTQPWAAPRLLRGRRDGPLFRRGRRCAVPGVCGGGADADARHAPGLMAMPPADGAGKAGPGFTWFLGTFEAQGKPGRPSGRV